LIRRVAALLAILAALLGAPSAALAAPPNQLADGEAWPTTGTPDTVFGLSVRYVSIRGMPAVSVTAEVGTLSVPLELAAGTAVDGTWTGSTELRPGTWPVTFHADASQGPDQTISGPTLSVAAPEAPAPTASGTPGGRDVQPSERPSQDGGPVDDEPSPSQDVKPGAGPRSSHGPAVASPAPTSRGGNARAGSSATPDPRPRSSASPAGPRGTPAERPSPPMPSRSSHAAPLPSQGDADRDIRGPLLLLGAVVSVTTVALLGTGWLLAARERGERPQPAPPGPARRRRPRRRVDPGDDDPVLAALGLDQAQSEPQSPRRGAVRGASPRPPRGRQR